MYDVSARVKKVGDREVKVVTQCVQEGNVSKCAPPTVGNILLKINAKLGGTNNVLGVNSRPVVSTTHKIRCMYHSFRVMFDTCLKKHCTTGVRETR